MRDIVFVLFFIVLVFFSIRRPFISLTIWLWSGLFVPFYWLYGFASSISYNSIAAFLTIGGYLVRKNKARFKINLLFVFVIAFFIHTTITSITTITIPALVWQTWDNFFKAILFLYFHASLYANNTILTCFYGLLFCRSDFLDSLKDLSLLHQVVATTLKAPMGICCQIIIIWRHYV